MRMKRLAVILAAGVLAGSAGLLTAATGASAATVTVNSPARNQLSPPPSPPPAVQLTLQSPGKHICYIAHVQNIGWQGWVCDGAQAGTTGMSLRMEALGVAVSPDVGRICADAHVQNIGWQGWVCQDPTNVLAVGTTGQSLRMEALSLNLPAGNGDSAHTVCANAHVENIGWMGTVCGPAITVGTTGQSLRMEAVTITTP